MSGAVPCNDVPPDLAEVLRQLGKQLQEVSDKISPVEKMDWGKALETAEDHENTLVNTWKDELSNLLIFTGLFSAVVTSFSAQSYTMLQPDPTQTSAIILERISLQLASFTIANGMLTSRTPNLSITNVTDAIGPISGSAVTINILWVLSLTLSLLAALFAIAIQQWLRHLRPPAHLAMRTALTLRQFRYENLRRWQIPGIISLLPVLVQASVVLFLAGLMLLLHSLTNKVAIPFIAVAGVGVILFLIATLIPLFRVSCAYKSESSLIPIAMLHWMAYPLALAASSLGILVDAIVQLPSLKPVMKPFNNARFYFDYIHSPNERITEYVRSFKTRVFMDHEQYWTARELRSIEKIQEDDELDCRGLCQALLNMRPQHFTRVQSCLTVFKPSVRMKCALRAVVRVLGFGDASEVLRVYPQLMGNTKLYHRAAQIVSDQHVRLLLAALPPEISGRAVLDGRDELVTSRILVLLDHVTRDHGHASHSRSLFLSRLCAVRDGQAAAIRDVTPKVLVPTLLLFEHYERHFNDADYFQELDLARAVGWAEEWYTLSCRRSPSSASSNMVMAEMYLASTATAFLVYIRNSQTAFSPRLLDSLGEFLKDWHKFLTEAPYDSGTVGTSQQTQYQDLQHHLAPRAIHSICRSLARLESQKAISLDSDPRYKAIVSCLTAICSTSDEHLFREAMVYLPQVSDGTNSEKSSHSDPTPNIVIDEVPTISEASDNSNFLAASAPGHAGTTLRMSREYSSDSGQTLVAADEPFSPELEDVLSEDREER